MPHSPCRIRAGSSSGWSQYQVFVPTQSVKARTVYRGTDMAAETRALLAKGVPQGTAGKPSVFREQLWVNDYLSAPSCPWYMEVHKSAAVTIGGREVVAVWLHERLKLVLLV